MRSWCTYNKIRHMMTRTEERAEALSSPSDLVKMFDSLMQYTSEARSIQGWRTRPRFLENLQGLRRVIARCDVFMARGHASHWRSSAHRRSFRAVPARRLAGDAIRHHKARTTVGNAKSISEGIAAAEALIVAAGKEKARVAAEFALANAKHNSIGVVTNTNRPLMARLHDFDSGLAERSEHDPVFPAPTGACKPLFFDTASRGLSLPDVGPRSRKRRAKVAFERSRWFSPDPLSLERACG